MNLVFQTNFMINLSSFLAINYPMACFLASSNPGLEGYEVLKPLISQLDKSEMSLFRILI